VLRTDRLVNAADGSSAAASERSANHARGNSNLSLSHRYVVARIPTQANPRRLALSGDAAPSSSATRWPTHSPSSTRELSKFAGTLRWATRNPMRLGAAKYCSTPAA